MLGVIIDNGRTKKLCITSNDTIFGLYHSHHQQYSAFPPHLTSTNEKYEQQRLICGWGWHLYGWIGSITAIIDDIIIVGDVCDVRKKCNFDSCCTKVQYHNPT